MGRRVIEVPGLHHGAMPIPLAVSLGGLLVTGGISGTDPETGQRPADLDAEVAQVFRNLRAVLSAAGTGPESVLKLTFYVVDRTVRDAINNEWITLFPAADDRPARHVLVQELAAGMRIQAEMLAVTASEAS